MIELTLNDAEERMQKSVEVFKSELSKVRTGRAHTSLLTHIMVPYYGSNVPISQTANITVLDARTLGVNPFDKSTTTIIEKAIRNSDLGLNPTNMGDILRVPLPPMTEERRRELVKVVRHESENARVAVRNVRRDANHEFKGLLKESEITKDEDHRSEEVIQKTTNKFIKQIDEILAKKEAELMEV
ncbi:MAG: ribosome recycling factor [Thiomargarita sp.]|nr:ribosome recycling factor [Thiomargarita sp.]